MTPPELFWMDLLERHSGELTILLMFLVTILALIIIVPQLLRAHLRKLELSHQEHMRALEQGIPVPLSDDSSRVAGRATMLVPIVVVISAGTVTCFLVAYRSDNVFSVALAVWTVSGVVCLAAITGGVALIGRLAQLKAGDPEEVPANPFQD
jgi:hypothetical protein